MTKVTNIWKQYPREITFVGIILVIFWGIRYLAALHAGIEVDEPIYRYASAYAAQHGFPAVRAEAGQRVVPFLYHPPFFMLLLAQWFRLWHSTSFFTGRLFNVCASTVLLGLIYLIVRIKIGRIEAILALVLIGSDGWIIFTNQAIYLENTQLILIVLAVWVYWWATESTDGKRVVYRYFVAGILVGCVLIYKQIGGFLILSIFANWLMQRRHVKGHILLLVIASFLLGMYFLVMHLSFGSLFDSATLIQVRRTLGERSSPGLTYSPLTGIMAVANLYWMFIVTILVLIVGSMLAIVRGVQYFFRKRQGNTIILSWALGGVAFALSISLKSPHYMILWLIPLYIFVIQEGCQWAQSHLLWLQRETWITLIAVVLLLINVWSFQARFLHLSGDTLAEADSYINRMIPANTIIVTEDYIGTDIDASYVNSNLEQTPKAIYYSHAKYLALYWSTTEAIPASLGNVSNYCLPMATFTGFKDHVEVCQIDELALTGIIAPKKLVEQPVKGRDKPSQVKVFNKSKRTP